MSNGINPLTRKMLSAGLDQNAPEAGPAPVLRDLSDMDKAFLLALN